MHTNVTASANHQRGDCSMASPVCQVQVIMWGGQRVTGSKGTTCKCYINQLLCSLEISSSYKLCYSGAGHSDSPFSGNTSPCNLVWHQKTSTGFGRRKEFSSPEVFAQMVLPHKCWEGGCWTSFTVKHYKMLVIPHWTASGSWILLPYLSLSQGVFNHSTQTWTTLLHLYPLHGSRFFFFFIISLSI